MSKPTNLLILALGAIAIARADAAGEAFTAAPGAGITWSSELPARYLLSFELKGDHPEVAGIVRHEGQELLKVVAKGEWQTAQIAVNTESQLYSSWLGGKALVEEGGLVGKKSEKAAAAGGTWQSNAEDGGEVYGLGGDFTIAARFRSRAGGTLVAKCAPEGPWTPDSKALFIKGGRLVYDIGFLGALKGKSKVADGNWHQVVLVCGGGRVRVFVDGQLDAEKKGFSTKDPSGSVLKIGEASKNFGGSYDGEIDFVRFWKRELPQGEIAALGKGEEAKTNTPLLNWKPGVGEDPGPAAKREGLQFLSTGGKLSFRDVRVGPLAEVDHARLIRGWDHLALERGARIYNGLCVTCHGDQKIEGTLPTALRFHSGEFKNGNDPLSMYRTLSDGFNLMVAQPWMTPQQKYDVIHYIRETLIKEDNPDQFITVDEAYLEGLPKGTGIGSTEATMFADNKEPKYKKMNFGPAMFWTFEAGPGNIAYKGIAIRLDEGPGGISKGKKWMLYDHDTMRVAAAWTGDGFVNWRGIAFDQSHGSHTAIVGDVAFRNPVGPGWGRPRDGSFEEVRLRGRDDKPYGPLPRDWAHYEGLYLHGNRAVLHYTVGTAAVHELPGYEMHAGETIFTRTLNIGKATSDLKLRIAPESMAVAKLGGGELAVDEHGFHVLEIAAGATPLAVKILTAGFEDQGVLDEYAATSGKPIDLGSLQAGGQKRWPGLIQTDGSMGGDEKAFEVDEIELPWDERSPWNSWMRLGGFDFFEDGKRAAVATWLGDVWIVDGLGGEFGKHNWQRIATGLFQPLGVKVIDGTIYVSCRDQIAELHDKNGDGEIDYIRNFNNDHQVTEHFHEFAMGLQTDAGGNFYYAKSARHAKKALVPHHGTLLKVSSDGSQTTIVANGFRAANGVCLNPDGSFIVTDQEGHWNPKNRINWVKPGGFYGNMYGYHDVTDESDEAMDAPLCWITNKFDRSPGELMWVPENAAWGGLNGALLNLSYGMGRVFVVPHEKLADGRVQGGMISLGLDFPTGTMRGRFHPGDGQLYTAGMFAWAGNRQQDGGFYRIRATGKASNLPVGLKAMKGGMLVTFADELDPLSAVDAANYKVKVWGLKRTKNYGSPHVDEHALEISGVKLLEGGKRILISLPEIAPTWCMEIDYKLKSEDGADFHGTLNNTIHALGE